MAPFFLFLPKRSCALGLIAPFSGCWSLRLYHAFGLSRILVPTFGQSPNLGTTPLNPLCLAFVIHRSAAVRYPGRRKAYTELTCRYGFISYIRLSLNY
jgi:hypothetical protein